MSGIDFSKFSNGFKALWNKAVSDGVLSVEEQSKFDGNDLSIFYQMYKDSPEDFKGLKIERVAAQKSNSTLYSYIIDGEEYTEGTLDLKDKEKAKEVYPGADSAKLKNGIVTLYDKSEKVLTDAFGNPIRIDFSSGMKIDTSLEKVQGGFEKIENEDFQRTNRRFTIALIKTMFNRAIIANQQELDKLGLLDMRTWREIAGEGIQRLADSISEQQDMITANTMKRIERLKEERDAIIGKLEPLLDKPSSFAEEFSKLLGCSYQSTGMDNLRTTCFDEKSEKDGEIRYNKTVEGFKELYPENKVVKYLEGNSATKVMGNIASFCDSVADILAMFMLTGGIGTTYKTLGTTFKTFGKTLGKATLKNFTKTSELFIKNVVNKNYKAAIAQFPKLSTFMQGAVHSAATMSTYEGGKALINSTTNGEDLTDDEILSRTIAGFIGGAEMGVEMAGLQTFAIAPIMNKLSPVLGKMTGASSKIKELLKKNGEMSLEDISKVYDDCIQTTRGKIAQEGLHLGVSLPIMVPGFTGIDSAKAFLSNGDKSYNEDEFREQLLHNAKTQEERVRISAMNSFELKVEFVKRNFQAQLEGMTTIEGVSLALRRFQAARLAGQAVPKPVNNLLGAKIKTVEKDGKHLYEVIQENGKTLKFDMNDGKTVSKFSSPERAIAAYQAMCVKVVSEMQPANDIAETTNKIQSRYVNITTPVQGVVRNLEQLSPQDIEFVYKTRMNTVTTKDIDSLIKQYPNKNEQVLAKKILTKMGQFADINAFNIIYEQLILENCELIASKNNTSISDIFSYLSGKKAFQSDIASLANSFEEGIINSLKNGKKPALIIDASVLYAIEHSEKLQLFLRENQGSIKLVLLDGWFDGITAFNHSTINDISSKMTNIMTTVKDIAEQQNIDIDKALDIALNGNIMTKLKNLNLDKSVTIMQNRTNKPNTTESIAQQYSAIQFTEEQINNILKDFPTEYHPYIMEVLAQTSKPASMATLSAKAKEQYSAIINKANENNIPQENIYYLVPTVEADEGKKSYGMVATIYRDTNDIPVEKFINDISEISNVKNSMVVILDDFSGSGKSLIDDYRGLTNPKQIIRERIKKAVEKAQKNRITYKNINEHIEQLVQAELNKNVTNVLPFNSSLQSFQGKIVIAPLASTSGKGSAIENFAPYLQQDNNLSFLPAETIPLFLESDYIKELPVMERRAFKEVLQVSEDLERFDPSGDKADKWNSPNDPFGYNGFRGNATSIVFPYMAPNNNNAFFSSYIAPLLTLNGAGVKNRWILKNNK